MTTFIASNAAARPVQGGRVAVITPRKHSTLAPSKEKAIELTASTFTDSARLVDFFDMLDTVESHGYLSAAMSTVGRATVGSWWKLTKHELYGDKATARQYRRLYEFYLPPNRDWNTLASFRGMGYKLMIASMYLRMFGQAAFLITRNKAGIPLSLDFLHGLVVPNVDKFGNFLKPAFVQYLTQDLTDVVKYENPTDIVFITTPDWRGDAAGGSDIESLAPYTLPIDLHLLTAAREYLKNRDTPEVVYELPSDISADAFNTFVEEMAARRGGAANLGKNPIAMQGEFAVHELRPLPDALPYQESRTGSRDELLAVTGVSAAKLGLPGESAAAILALRREFHESTMTPLFRLISSALYEQVHVREFSILGWEFTFNAPDFMTAVERATVHMRYTQMGALSPNEIRAALGYAPRDGGDEFVDIAGSDDSTDEEPVPNPQGNPPDGRDDNPDAPSEVGEPSDSEGDPSRGDQHNTEPAETDAMTGELNKWRDYVIRRMKRTKALPKRQFSSTVLPEALHRIIATHLSSVKTAAAVHAIFDDAIKFVKENY